jgi:hypothetical protein
MPPKLGLLFGMLVPAFEILIGIALLNKGFRKLGVIMAVSMSLFLLTVLGPLGHNWNSVVWPWDIAMVENIFHKRRSGTDRVAIRVLMGDNDDFGSFGRDMVVNLSGGVLHNLLNRALY